jgi:hypothetical protein
LVPEGNIAENEIRGIQTWRCLILAIHPSATFGLSYFNAKCAEDAQRAQRIMKAYKFFNLLHNTNYLMMWRILKSK